jgi:hypothetical protein
MPYLGMFIVKGDREKLIESLRNSHTPDLQNETTGGHVLKELQRILPFLANLLSRLK